MKKSLLLLMSFLFVAVICLLLGKQCAVKQPVKDVRDSLKAVITSELTKRQELKKQALKSDSIVYRWRDRWHTAKTYTVQGKCDSVLPVIIRVADSVMVVDSAALAIKDSIIRLDDGIINQLQTVVKQDSIEILGLKKEVRNQKRQKWLAVILAGGVLAVRR